MAKLLYVYSADEMSCVVKIAKKHQLPISNGDLMVDYFLYFNFFYFLVKTYLLNNLIN